jgi:hypothetical protein
MKSDLMANKAIIKDPTGSWIPISSLGVNPSSRITIDENYA